MLTTAIGTRRMAQRAFLKDEPCSRPGHPSRGLAHTNPGNPIRDLLPRVEMPTLATLSPSWSGSWRLRPQTQGLSATRFSLPMADLEERDAGCRRTGVRGTAHRDEKRQRFVRSPIPAMTPQETLTRLF